MGERRLPPQHWECHPEIELIEHRKPAPMHHDTDEDRLDTAERLAVQNPRAAGAAFAAIARDDAVGDEVRLSAAELLANLSQEA